jgi:hypothetical protein
MLLAMPAAPRTSSEDPALRATVASRRPLRYGEGHDPGLDRPGHVRAGSGLGWLGGRLAVVQDDANFLALVDPRTGRTTALTLPAGDGGRRQFDAGRGNKHRKLDLEACVVIDERLVAFGSGSTPARETLLVVVPGRPAELVELPGLYRALREAPGFCGRERGERTCDGQLNIEGVALHGQDLVFFQRGNGAPVDGVLPVNATCRIDRQGLLAHLAAPASAPVPAVRDVRPWELGRVEATRLSFTDAAATFDDRLLFLAAAEDSPDAYDDGPIAGTVLGVLDGFDGPAPMGRHALLRDAAGAPVRIKAEGLALDRDDARRAWLVVDADDPDEPAELLEVRLEGPW